MSFGARERELDAAFEAASDLNFTTLGVVYFASAGDSPGTEYPSVSPNVVSAGGTSISRNTPTGDFFLESTWQDAGDGPSLFEPRPAFQNGVIGIVGNARGTPDFSFDSNPTSGVWVFDSNPKFGTGWFVPALLRRPWPVSLTLPASSRAAARQKMRYYTSTCCSIPSFFATSSLETVA
jgi:hypothetical protein